MSKKRIVIEGKVTCGAGMGAYYIKAYLDKMNEKLNFIPYAGTLNIELNKKFINIDFDKYASVIIDEFKKDDLLFGMVKFIPAKLIKNRNFGEENCFIDCFIAIPKRTHHKGVIEIISSLNLRKEMDLCNGDVIELIING